MKRVFSHLTLADRRQIERGRQMKMSAADIARRTDGCRTDRSGPFSGPSDSAVSLDPFTMGFDPGRIIGPDPGPEHPGSPVPASLNRLLCPLGHAAQRCRQT
ncbi:helix-turn-helix domain-containing protein [uncultured Mameliella sp.]|uniref:helix-turn-helix domain-containing protein n=1 Tax=uncultured Mameliella sp. TaxID=1447087 RepID=UPI00345CB109